MGTKATKFVEQTKIEEYRLALPEPEYYKLVDNKGGGELVKLTREAIKAKNFTLLDKTIKEKIAKFLYNDGRGDYINIEDLIKSRMSTKSNLLKKILQENDDQNKLAKTRYTKYVCFDIEKRGKFGETILHTCLRNCETVHNELAKRIINVFPQMINDFSLSEELYGETPLHSAIAIQNPEMVRILLSKRANVHARCIGTMFGPQDQKFNRKDILNSEFPILKGKTSFEGFAYLGEYPLNFAACLNQEECVRLLLAKGADPNKQDMFGNTTLHMMVLHDNIKLFQLVWAQGVEMNIKNKQGYTPLVLAAKMNTPDIYEHILEDVREMNWTYADISCASYPLNNLDSIGPDGKTDFESVLMTLVNSHEEEHLEMFEGVILELINQKWELYCKFKFYCQFALFIVYMAVCGATILMKRAYFFHLDDQGCVIASDTGRHLIPECQCAYLHPNDSNKNFRMFAEILTILLTVFYAAIFITELLAQKISVTIQHLYKNPFKAVFICGIICTLIIIPMRFTCNTYGEDVLTCLAIIVMPFYILYLARGFQRTSMFVFTIHKGISWNFYVWACISMIFYMGFSQGLYIAAGYGLNQPLFFVNPITAILNCLTFSDHDFSRGYLALKESPYPEAGKLLLFFVAVFCNIIMTNMLIASFLELYAEIVKSKLEWIRQWAMNVIAIELTMKPSERLKQQKKYVQYAESGEKSIIVRWKENSQELQESRLENFDTVREQLFSVPDSASYNKS